MHCPSLYVLFLILFAFGCTQQTNERILITLETSQIAEEIQAPNTTIIDVRTPEEYNSGHIPGAINIDYSSEEFESLIGDIDRDTKLVIYCAAGGRSGSALDKMDLMGFNHVFNLEGGYNAWIRNK